MDFDEQMSDEELNVDNEDAEVDVEEDHDAVLQECVESFSSADYIMEPTVFVTLQKYFKAGGLPEQVVLLLSGNYKALAQMANLLAEWLILSGADISTVQELVEEHLKDLILKHFDTKKADTIFTDGETPPWLQEMISFSTWRYLFYKLAEEYPDCLMLNFTIKLISDAGYQGEITSVSTACHQLEVFSRVLKTSITGYLKDPELFLNNSLQDFSKMVCHAEHTYLYTQILLRTLSMEGKGGPKVRRLAQELQKQAKERGLNVTAISTAMVGGSAHARACQAAASMMTSGTINPADVTVLHTAYSSPDPPPIELLRNPLLLELFLEGLFNPRLPINPDYRTKYLHILAFATTVTETYRKGVRKSISKDELRPTETALDKAQKICSDNKGGNELITDIPVLFQQIKYPVAAAGVLTWLGYILTEPQYFVTNTDQTPLHFVILDEVTSQQTLLHTQVFSILSGLFESTIEDLDVLVQLEVKKCIIDRMVHLLIKGYVMPVLSYIRTCYIKQHADISLIRHFVTEVLEVITPPYSEEFVNEFHPLISDENITSSLKNDTTAESINKFMNHCKTTFSIK